MIEIVIAELRLCENCLYGLQLSGMVCCAIKLGISRLHRRLRCHNATVCCCVTKPQSYRRRVQRNWPWVDTEIPHVKAWLDESTHQGVEVCGLEGEGVREECIVWPLDSMSLYCETGRLTTSKQANSDL